MLDLEGWSEWVARDQQLRVTNTSFVNLASSLTQHAEDTVGMADTALVGLVERVETDGTSPAAHARLDRLLTAQVIALSRVCEIVVLCEDGRWLASSLPVKGGNSADRDYFRYHRDNLDPGLFISPPVLSRVTGCWTLIAYRRGLPGPRCGIWPGCIERRSTGNPGRGSLAPDGERMYGRARLDLLRARLVMPA